MADCLPRSSRTCTHLKGQAVEQIFLAKWHSSGFYTQVGTLSLIVNWNRNRKQMKENYIFKNIELELFVMNVTCVLFASLLKRKSFEILGIE